MSNYAAYNADESWVESPFFETEQEAIKWITDATGMSWNELSSDDYYIQNFTDEERTTIEEAPEV